MKSSLNINFNNSKNISLDKLKIDNNFKAVNFLQRFLILKFGYNKLSQYSKLTHLKLCIDFNKIFWKKNFLGFILFLLYLDFFFQVSLSFWYYQFCLLEYKFNLVLYLSSKNLNDFLFRFYNLVLLNSWSFLGFNTKSFDFNNNFFVFFKLYLPSFDIIFIKPLFFTFKLYFIFSFLSKNKIEVKSYEHMFIFSFLYNIDILTKKKFKNVFSVT